ncbi:hypothetical protein A5881_003850 [Enterococcus termitis]|nr:hypothetical protein A5881_003763 [Enterococcus termitis]
MVFESERYRYRWVSHVVENKIKEIREEQGISRITLAKDAGVSYDTIRRLENSSYVPTLLVAYDIAAALNKTIEEIFFF